MGWEAGIRTRRQDPPPWGQLSPQKKLETCCRFWNPRRFLVAIDLVTSWAIVRPSPTLAERVWKSQCVSWLVGAVVGANRSAWLPGQPVEGSH